MDARLDLFTNPVAAKFIKHINAASQVARTAGVPLDTLELMALRAERAALELAEEGTRLADGSRGVSDAVWENAAKH